VPTYDYRCRDCGHTIEIIHSILEDGPDACERCRGPLVRVLHPAGVIFKGSGFYVTDSRRSGGSSDSPTSASDPGGESKANTKKTADPGGSSASGTGSASD
jgi:putative FmdB family regulatory protein